MDDKERIERLEVCVAALAEMLTMTNPHIEHQLMELAQAVTHSGEIAAPEDT